MSRAPTLTTFRDAALALGATLRLTRLVVADDLGEWWIKTPLTIAATERYRRHGRDTPAGVHAALGGLDCPFCVGQWVAFTVLAATTVTDPTSRAGRGWRWLMAGLTLNYVAAHLGAVLGDTADDGNL